MDIFETIPGLPFWASVLLAVMVSFVLLALVNYSIELFYCALGRAPTPARRPLR
jgi:hypothetical protein